MQTPKFVKTFHLTPEASAVLDAYKMLHPEFEKRAIGNDAILQTMLPRLPDGITRELAKQYPAIQKLLRKN